MEARLRIRRATISMVILVAAMVLGASCVTTGGESEGFGPPGEAVTADGFKKWFGHYYETPNPKMTPYYIRYMREQGYLQARPEMTMVFLSKVFDAEPLALQAWAKDWSNFEQGDRNILWGALLLASGKPAEDLLREELRRGADQDKARFATFLETLSILKKERHLIVREPAFVPSVWAAFYATGDLAYVERVMAMVPLYNAKEGSVEHEMGKTALWSVAGHALNHKIVLKHVTKMAAGHPNTVVRAYLAAILEALEKGKAGEVPAYPKNPRDLPFSASAAKDWATPR